MTTDQTTLDPTQTDLPQTEHDEHVEPAAPSPDLQHTIDALAAELAEARAAIARGSREREVLRAATDSGALDTDAVLALLNTEVNSESTTFDARKAVDALKFKKPLLFAPRPAQPAPRTGGGGGGVMGPREESEGGGAGEPATARAAKAAQIAAETGDRNALLTYLRLKREAAD